MGRLPGFFLPSKACQKKWPGLLAQAIFLRIFNQIAASRPRLPQKQFKTFSKTSPRQFLAYCFL
jgi:hypothetical protein